MSNIGAGRDAINIGNANNTNIVIASGDQFQTGTPSGSQDRQDEFQPSFYTPSNPKEVVLDFGNSFDHTRPQTQEAKVLQELLREDYDQEETRIVTVYGKGGVGKSCILRALAAHEKVKERFPDGVYFLSFGMDAGIDDLIKGLVEIALISGAQELGRELQREGKLQILLKKIREWMRGKKCLLLLDDFWERNELGGRVLRELAQLFSYGSGSVVALTTRFASIATQGTKIEIEPHQTTSKRAEAILLSHAKFKREEIEHEETSEVFVKLLKICGGLPLFLSVIGKAVAELCVELKNARTVVWKVYWKMIESQEEMLFETESDEYPDLCKTLRMSLKILCDGRGKQLGSLSISGYSLFEMHRALSVFKKQTAIPMSVCRRLWNVKSVEAAARIGKRFADVGLGDIEVNRVGERHVMFLRLHDLVHIFAVQCANESNEVTDWHERLLEAYISRARHGESMRRWWDVEERSGEEYLFGNLCRHLARSGNVKELLGLLLSGEWTKFRLKQGGLSAWKHDISEYLGPKGSVPACEREKETEDGMRMVRDAVVESWAAVHGKPQDLGFQVFGRLVDSQNAVVAKYLESVERAQRGPWLEPMQRLWTRPGEGRMIAEFDLGDYIRDIAVQKDPFVAVAAVGMTIAIIDLKEMTVRSRCVGHTELVRKVGISAGGERVLSWSDDCTVRQWHFRSGKEDTNKCIRLEINADDEVTCAEFCPDKSVVITGSKKGWVKVWDLNSGERVGSALNAMRWVRCIGVSPNGDIIAAGVNGGVVLLWDAQTWTRLGRELEGSSNVSSISFSSDGRYVASAGGRTLRLCY